MKIAYPRRDKCGQGGQLSACCYGESGRCCVRWQQGGESRRSRFTSLNEHNTKRWARGWGWAVQVQVGAEVKRTGQEAWRARLFLREMKVSGAGGTRAVGEMKARRDAETLTVNGLGAS